MNYKRLSELEEVVSLMTQGEYEWWESADGVDVREYINSITDGTERNNEENDLESRVHSVGVVQSELDKTIALTGFGPKSAANARGITALLRSFPELLVLAKFGLKVRDAVHEYGGLHLKYWDDLSECGYRAWVPHIDGCQRHATAERAIEAAISNEYANKFIQEVE